MSKNHNKDAAWGRELFNVLTQVYGDGELRRSTLYTVGTQPGLCFDSFTDISNDFAELNRMVYILREIEDNEDAERSEDLMAQLAVVGHKGLDVLNAIVTTKMPKWMREPGSLKAANMALRSQEIVDLVSATEPWRVAYESSRGFFEAE